MNDHRYILASNKLPKLDCPYCGAKKHWQRYLDIETGEAIPEYYGKCDNDNKCGHWNDPYKLGYAKMIWEQERGNRSELPNNWKPKPQKVIQQPTPGPVFFDFDTFEKTLETDRYEDNTFIQNLLKNVKYPFDIMDVGKVILLYKLGAIVKGYRAGAITFPFIDIKGNVRAVQVKQFDENNHTTGTDFLHSMIEKHYTRNNKPLPEWLKAYTKQDKKVSCLFGEHLLSKYPQNPIALVEAPKTAIYSTLYFGLPETPKSLIWLAVYNKSSFSFDKLKVLKGHFVFVFPDLSKDGNTFKEWETKAKEYESRLPGTRFIFSDLLEQLAPEQDKSKGYDIADYLIKQDWRLFRKHNIQEQPPQPEPEKVTKVTPQNKLYFPHGGDKSKVEPSNLDKMPVAKKGEWLDEHYPTNGNQYTKKSAGTTIAPAPLPVDKHESSNTRLIAHEPPENWINEIKELENYFAGIEPPTQPVKLNEWTTITDYNLFIESHFATVKANNGNKTFLPYLNRLKKLKQILAKGKIYPLKKHQKNL